MVQLALLSSTVFDPKETEARANCINLIFWWGEEGTLPELKSSDRKWIFRTELSDKMDEVVYLTQNRLRP